MAAKVSRGRGSVRSAKARFVMSVMFCLGEFVSGMVKHGMSSQPRFCFARYGELWNGEFRFSMSVTEWLGAVCQVSVTRDKQRQDSRVQLSFVEPGRVWVMRGKSD